MENEPRLTSGIDPAIDGLRLDPKTEAGAKFAADLSRLIEHGLDEDKAIELLSVTWPYKLVFYERGAVELLPEDF